MKLKLKNKFHQHKNTFLIYDVDMNKAVVSINVSLGKKSFKYFIGYKDGKKVRPLCIILPKMSKRRREFDETK